MLPDGDGGRVCDCAALCCPQASAFSYITPGLLCSVTAGSKYPLRYWIKCDLSGVFPYLKKYGYPYF